jgi:hypothetical protein
MSRCPPAGRLGIETEIIPANEILTRVDVAGEGEAEAPANFVGTPKMNPRKLSAFAVQDTTILIILYILFVPLDEE